MTQAKQGELIVLTVGHSTRPIGEFVELLKAHGVERVVDVRTVPKSRRNPQFGQDLLPGSLAAADMGYTHMPALGGLRRPRPDSPNTGWRNESFRGYADHMQTPQFAAALEEVIALAKKQRIALMCAEAVPWRCHRSLIADALLARGISAEDITGPGRSAPHRLTPFARVRGSEVTYPREGGSQDLFEKAS